MALIAGSAVRIEEMQEREGSSTTTSSRCAVAARKLQPGEVALQTNALAAVLHEDQHGRRCDHCFCTPQEVASGAEAPLSRCARCKTTYYCSRACQEADWRLVHKAECSATALLKKALIKEGLVGQGAFKDALLAGRCVRAVARGSTAASGALADLESLDGRLEASECDQLQKIASAVASVPKLLPAESDGSAVFDALCRFRNNNFAVVDDLFIAIGAGCFPNGASLNHSCAPNCLLTYRLRPGQAPIQEVRVMEEVQADVELTHSYVDIALPSWERQAQLREDYYFDCACRLCNISPDGAKTSSIKMRSIFDERLVAGAEGKGAVLFGDDAHCPLPRAPASAARDEALMRAQVLMQQAARTEDATAELALLEEVCSVREQWLHRHHLEVLAAHASAHTAAMAAANWEAAGRHCQRLVEQYQLVYPEWHPISGLQIYTLAELKEHSGEVEEARRCYEQARRILRVTHGQEHNLVEALEERLR